MKRTTTLFTLSAIAAFTLLSLKTDHVEVKYADYHPIAEYSSSPPTKRVGGFEGDCTFCHDDGIPLSAVGTVTFDFAGLDTAYIPGQTYNISIGVASGPKNGFEMTILDGNLQKAGDFINGSNTGTALDGGREYIYHTASVGITTWNFQWTAPSSDMGDLRAYYAYNKTNANGNAAGDLVYVGDEEIYSSEPVSISEAKSEPFKVNAYWDGQSRLVHVDYELTDAANIVVNVQSLSGQLIQSTDLGFQESGQYHDKLSVKPLPKGIYLVSVFVNKRVFNKKIMFN